MPFRGADDETSTAPIDGLAQFWELVPALDRRRSWYQSRGSVLSAAALLVPQRDAAASLADRTWDANDRLASGFGRFSALGFPLRLILAALLVHRGDAPEAFVAEVRRVRARFRELRVRRCGLFEVFATLALHVQSQGRIDDDRLRRLSETFAGLRAQWGRRVSDDLLPICALLGDEPPVALARLDATYHALAELPRMHRRKPSLRVAGVLATFGRELAPDLADPREIAARFERMLEGFEAAGTQLVDEQWGAVAATCLLAHPSERIVASVLDVERRLRPRLPSGERSQAFSLASTLAFAELIARDPRLGSLAEIRSLLDMHAAVTAAAAAAIGLTAPSGG